MPAVLQEPDASKKAADNQNTKKRKEQNMNFICLSTDSTSLRWAWTSPRTSVQAELRRAGGKTVRFGFENNAKGFAQLARVLKEHNVPKVWAGDLSSKTRTGLFVV